MLRSLFFNRDDLHLNECIAIYLGDLFQKVSTYGCCHGVHEFSIKTSDINKKGCFHMLNML